MSRGYTRFGHAVSAMYGFDDHCYPFDPTGSRRHIELCSLDKEFAHYLAHSPYLSKKSHPDKTDPEAAISLPPFGHVWSNISEKFIEVRARDEHSGSGLDAAYFYFKGNLWGFQTFARRSARSSRNASNDNSIQHIRFQQFPDAHTHELTPGCNLFSVSVTDRAGNSYYNILKTFVLDRSDNIVNNMFFVSPPNVLRNKNAERGSSVNPYSSIMVYCKFFEKRTKNTF